MIGKLVDEILDFAKKLAKVIGEDEEKVIAELGKRCTITDTSAEDELEEIREELDTHSYTVN